MLVGLLDDTSAVSVMGIEDCAFVVAAIGLVEGCLNDASVASVYGIVDVSVVLVTRYVVGFEDDTSTVSVEGILFDA